MSEPARPKLRPVSGLKPSDLPTPPPRRAKAVPDAPAAATAASTAVDTAANAARTPAIRTSKLSQTADTIRAISISLPAPLAAHAKQRARDVGLTQAELLMDAIVATQDQLNELVTQLQPQPVHDSLFIRTTKSGGETYVALSLRMHSANVDVLDRLVDEHRADSRSQLCAAALVGYLDRAAK